MSEHRPVLLVNSIDNCMFLDFIDSNNSGL